MYTQSVHLWKFCEWSTQTRSRFYYVFTDLWYAFFSSSPFFILVDALLYVSEMVTRPHPTALRRTSISLWESLSDTVFRHPNHPYTLSTVEIFAVSNIAIYTKCCTNSNIRVVYDSSWWGWRGFSIAQRVYRYTSCSIQNRPYIWPLKTSLCTLFIAAFFYFAFSYVGNHRIDTLYILVGSVL